MAAGVSGWLDKAVRGLHAAVDGLHRAARNGTRRPVFVLKPSGEVLFATHLTAAVGVVLISALFLLPVLVVALVVGGLLGFRVRTAP